MNAELKEIIAACETCRTYETGHHKESPMPHKIPNRPGEQVALDFFELNNKEYMITVDYYSNSWEIDRLTSTTSSAVVLQLKNHFVRYGCPNHLISDNGPQIVSSEFCKFASDWDFEHRTSYPGNSKANGKVESAVKTAKNLLRRALSARTDPYTAILDYRNTPTQGIESSPAQRLMNRRTRTLLPTTKTLLQPRAPQSEGDVQQLNRRQFQQCKYYNQHARDLPPLKEDDVVRMKPFHLGSKEWKKGTIASKLDERSYMVETPDGDTYRRNRYHLRRTTLGTNVKGLTMAHLNIRSLVKNIDELRQFVCTNNLDVLTLSETWLDSSFSDEEIAIDNFRMERCDRCRNGGGTAMLIHERFVYDRLPLSPELNNLEMVMCAVKLPRSRPPLIGSVYRPPDDKNFTGLFMKYLEQLAFESSEIFLLGDFY